MDIKRFYIEKAAISGSYITLSGEEFVHLAKVLRYKVGYSLIACDGSGKDYLCKIIKFFDDKALCEITDILDNDTESIVDVTLYLGLIKNEKMTIAVQKAVELGVKRIVLFRSAYTSEKEANIERYNKVAKEAAKQCGRARVPEIDGVYDYEQIVFDNNGVMLMAYEKENKVSYKQIVKNLCDKNIGIIIGSEGGFSDDEAALAKSKGIQTFTLGKRILRAETAAIVTLGYLMQELEE